MVITEVLQMLWNWTERLWTISVRSMHSYVTIQIKHTVLCVWTELISRKGSLLFLNAFVSAKINWVWLDVNATFTVCYVKSCFDGVVRLLHPAVHARFYIKMCTEWPSILSLSLALSRSCPLRGCFWVHIRRVMAICQTWGNASRQ